MKKRTRFIIASCIILLIGISCAIIINRRTLIERIAVVAMTNAFESGMKPTRGEIESRYDLRPVPHSISGDELQAALDILSRSFFLVSRHKNLVRVEGDVFLLPNSEFAKIDVIWNTVTSKDGNNILKEVTDDEKSEYAGFVGVPLLPSPSLFR